MNGETKVCIVLEDFVVLAQVRMEKPHKVSWAIKVFEMLERPQLRNKNDSLK